MKATCPLGGNCRVDSVVYRAEVSSKDKTAYYYGLTESDFKTRYHNHTHSFKHRKNIADTELSKYVWRLKDEDIPFNIKWNIAAKARTYEAGSSKCDLCLTEKLAIALADKNGLLNRRSEIISKCRHKNKFMLKKVK